jgi:pyridoxal phosphate-dependent aminotransferase EpsN
VGRIYLSPPDVGDPERDALLRAFDSNWITTMGAEVDGFEADLVQFTGVEAAVALASGTAALHLALLLHGVGLGDEVWVSTFTFVAPANAVRYVGADLRFVDSERATWNMDPDLLEQALEDAAAVGRLPKAVIAVDLYGQCAQLDRISAACERFDVVLIEDAAEALGAAWQGRHAGTWGRLAAFSFNGNKIITTSGGGMLVGDRELVDRARYLAQQARQPVLHYEHTDVGYNYRLSNLLAAMGRAQLAGLPARIERRHQINAAYRAALGGIHGIDFMPWDERGNPNGWLSVLTLDPELGVLPAELCAALEQVDIEARPAWKPMHLQPVFGGVPCFGGHVAEELFARGVCLPSGSGMSEADVEQVVDAVSSAVARVRA